MMLIFLYFWFLFLPLKMQRLLLAVKEEGWAAVPMGSEEGGDSREQLLKDENASCEPGNCALPL